MEAKKWAIDNGWIDPNRIAIKGRSFGGYLSLLGATLNPNDFVCAIAEMPIVNPRTWKFKNTLPYFSSWDQIHSESATTSISVLDYASNLRGPLLMIHSENDLRVHVSQSQLMAETLHSYQIPFEYHIFPGDGHELRDPENRRRYHILVQEYLSKYLPIE